MLMDPCIVQKGFAKHMKSYSKLGVLKECLPCTEYKRDMHRYRLDQKSGDEANSCSEAHRPVRRVHAIAPAVTMYNAGYMWDRTYIPCRVEICLCRQTVASFPVFPTPAFFAAVEKKPAPFFSTAGKKPAPFFSTAAKKAGAGKTGNEARQTVV